MLTRKNKYKEIVPFVTNWTNPKISVSRRANIIYCKTNISIFQGPPKKIRLANLPPAHVRFKRRLHLQHVESRSAFGRHRKSTPFTQNHNRQRNPDVSCQASKNHSWSRSIDTQTAERGPTACRSSCVGRKRLLANQRDAWNRLKQEKS